MSRVEDTALLQAPVKMGKDGLESIIQIWNDATVEVKNILNNECNILLQCRCCRNVFRSLVNFISHKRGFCRTLYGSPNEAALTKCHENSKQSSDRSDVDVTGTHKAVKKTKGLLKRLNIVGVLNKRIEHLESKYDLSTLPKIERTIPETTFRNGVQVLKIRPKPIDQSMLTSKQRTALVIPQDHCVQYLDMNLRRRENNQKENCVREVGDDEVDVMDRLERFKPGLADFGSLKCLGKKCGDIGSFTSIFVLAYHISIKHNSRYLTDGSFYCFLCGSYFSSYAVLVEHLQKNHGEHRKLHYEARSLQALEKEQKRNRKIKNSDTKTHSTISERLRSLSPCTEEEIGEITASVSEQRFTDQQRLKFLHSKSDRNLEKSDDDEVALHSDENKQVSRWDNDKAILECMYCMINQVCSNGSKILIEPSESRNNSSPVKTDCASINDNCSKHSVRAIRKSSSSGINIVNAPKQVCVDTEVHSLNGKDTCDNGSVKMEGAECIVLDRQGNEVQDSKDEVVESVVPAEANVKRSDKKAVEDSSGTYHMDSKKTRKIQSDKGKKKSRKRGRKTTKASVALKDDPDKQPANKRTCSKAKCEVTEPERPNVYNTRRCVLRSDALISPIIHTSTPVMPTTSSAATATATVTATAPVLGTADAPPKTEGTYSCRRRVVKRKILQKEESKPEHEVTKRRTQTRTQFEKELRKCSNLKRMTATDTNRAKRLRLDELRSSTTSVATTSGKSEQSYGSLGETVRYRYRRFSHQCLPISSIDVVFVPKRKSTNTVSRQVPHIKDPGPSNVNITSDAMKKTGAFLRRNYLAQRKEDPAIVTTQNGAGNAASFMDPSSIPVYMTEAENKAIFSFVVPDKTSPGKLYRCRYCNDTFESEMDSRKHAVGHLRIIRLRCSLCGCCSFFCSDMRIHLQMRHCEKLNRAPAHIVAPGRKIPCMTYNQADSLIEVAVKEKPGRVAFTSGKIISNVSYKPYYPDAVTERKILENTSLKDVTETVP